MIVLCNPTNERFDMQHGGVSVSMKANSILEVSDACGNHLLNAFGGRGLTQFTYGCDEKKLKEDAIERNFEFKKRQVIEYNQRNENRKQTGLPYLPPTKHIKAYAVELKLQLLEPYSVRDEERGKIGDLQDKNRALNSQIVDLQVKLTTLLERFEKEDAAKAKAEAEAKGKAKKDE